MTSLQTPLCDLFGIDYPVFSAGMGTAARDELAAATRDPEADADEDIAFFFGQFAAAAEAGAAAVVLFWGDSAPFVDELASAKSEAGR